MWARDGGLEADGSVYMPMECSGPYRAGRLTRWSFGSCCNLLQYVSLDVIEAFEKLACLTIVVPPVMQHT